MLGVTGVSLFSLGAMFNHLVSLFQKRLVQGGLFGKPDLRSAFGDALWLARHDCSRGRGNTMAVVLLIVAVSGGTLEQMWLWMIASAMAILIGVQLIVARVIMNVLDDLSQREIKQELDMQGNPIKPA